MRLPGLIRLLLATTCAIVVLLATGSARADTAPRLLARAHLEPAGPVVAGTQVKLVVDLLTTTWFTEAPAWPLFTVPGAIVSLPDEQAANLHEVINGVSWFGVSRAYRIAPQTAKTFDIPPVIIDVFPGGMSGMSGATGASKLTTPPLKLVATVPAGAEGMRVFFPTPKLTATQKIEPSLARVKVGDAITRTITQTAAGTESMLIPPVDFEPVAGLKQYPKPQATKNVVQDRVGLVAGERTDTMTYVVNRSGRYTLAPVTIEWWNTTTRKKESIVLPAVSFSAVAVKEKPLFDIPVDAIERGAAHRIVVIDRTQGVIAALVLTAMLALVWAYPRLRALFGRVSASVAAARRRYAQGDAPAWRALRRAARNGSLEETIPRLYRWMDRSPDFAHPARVDAIDATQGAPLKRLIEAVRAYYAGRAGASLQWNETETALRRATKKARKKRAEKPPLPPLNEY
ncbi:BatD family protein [Paraburkholderia sartisoli]|uniref:Oxygen tolerance n=1 Tax=Paraburkholderia sartisoli TaxID=83784 RepID=A0A1H4H6C7_9BURK|nr:BatD family protein [Paraburkholderia sartisoli]SEB16622.1 Oxygen tolerance [Paraburkholderia sartisoli]